MTPLQFVEVWGKRVADTWWQAFAANTAALNRARWGMEAFARQMQADPYRRPARTGHRHRGTRAWMRRYRHR